MQRCCRGGKTALQNEAYARGLGLGAGRVTRTGLCSPETRLSSGHRNQKGVWARSGEQAPVGQRRCPGPEGREGAALQDRASEGSLPQPQPQLTASRRAEVRRSHSEPQPESLFILAPQRRGNTSRLRFPQVLLDTDKIHPSPKPPRPHPGVVPCVCCSSLRTLRPCCRMI